MATSAHLLTWVTLVSLLVLGALGENVNVTICYANDLRYDIFPLPSPDSGSSVCVDDKDGDVCFGGLSRLIAKIEGPLNSSENASLWLNAGNLLGGENYNLLKFHTAARALNFLKFNASSLGPELFRYGLEPASAFVSSGEISTMLASNWGQSKAVQNSSLFSLGERCHAAVIGFLDKQQADEMKVFGVNVEAEKTAIERELAAIQAANKDKKVLYIALGSASIEGAKAIAAIPDIDLVIFSGGNFSATENPEERAFLQPVEVDNKTSWVSSVNRNFHGMDSRFLIGQLDLQLTEECKIAVQPGMSLVEYVIGDKVSDPELTKFLSSEAQKVADMLKVVARSKVNLLPALDVCLQGECSLGGLIADALLVKLDSLNETQPWADSPKLAVIPGGMIQNVENVTSNITVRGLYDLFAQDEFVCAVTLTGPQLTKMMEIAVNPVKSSKPALPDLLQVSGSMRVEFNKKKVSSLWAVSESSESMSLTPIDLTSDKTSYKVALPSSMLYQWENYGFLREVGNPVHYDVSVVDALRGLVERSQGDNYISLPASGGRLIWRTGTPQPIDCSTNTGGAVILTLVAVAAIAVSVFIVWKIIVPKYRTRRGSTTQLLP